MTISHPTRDPLGARQIGNGADHAREFLERNVHVCSGMLVEAHRLMRIGQSGPVLAQFVHRARQLLAEMDEVRVALNPTRDAALLTRVAALHGTLESVQAAAHLVRQDGQADPKAGIAKS